MTVPKKTDEALLLYLFTQVKKGGVPEVFFVRAFARRTHLVVHLSGEASFGCHPRA